MSPFRKAAPRLNYDSHVSRQEKNGRAVTGTKTVSFGSTARQNHDSTPFYQRALYDGSRLKKPDTPHSPPSPPLKASPTQLELDIIHRHDSQQMCHLPDGSVHLMVTSPPYNVGKDYDVDLSLESYKTLLGNVLAETYRVLVDGGRACVNIANVGRKPYIPLHAYIITLAEQCGFSMRGEVIWDKGASAGSSCAWGSWRSASNPTLRDVHEYILVFQKGTFQRHPIGENTLSRDDFLEHTKSVWRFPTTSAKRAQHPAPFPLELPRRLINLYSYKGDIVLDPFMGSGTTALASVATGRHYVGYELEQRYIDVAHGHLSRAQLALL